MAPAYVPYCGSPPTPVELAGRWNMDPLLLALLAVAFFLCWRANCRRVPLMGGFAVLLLLYVSPLCALGSALFSMRAAHHVVLTGVAAPLLALALPRGGRSLTLLTLAHALIFWAWHIPQAYAFALASVPAYWLMQSTLFLSALALWRAVLSAPAPAATASLLATMVQMGLLGALLTFAGTPVYAWHIATTQSWGLSPLEDQQLAGLVMWVPGAALYLAASLWIAGAWLNQRQGAMAR